MALFTIGCDPEVMLERDGKLRSAIRLVKGTKKRPFVVDKGAVQHDNVNAEFNILPSSSKEEFVGNIGTVLKQLVRIVHPNKVVVRASANFPEKELRHPEARMFGCDPDFDAWSASMIVVPPRASASTFRSAGGHLHVGAVNGRPEILLDPWGKLEVIKTLDIMVGIPSLLLDKDPTSKARRQLYGKAGSHRPTSYGVEYRALGNYWISSPVLTEIVYDLTEAAVQLLTDGRYKKLLRKVSPVVVQETINDSKTAAAEEITSKIIGTFISENLKKLVAETARREEMQDVYEAWRL